MELLLLKYGYVFLFIGTFVEGEAFLLAGAFLARQGYFSIAPVAAVALAANTLGSHFYYMVARARGRPWFENRFSHSRSYGRVFQWMGNYGNLLLLLSRFAVGFRIIIPAACGAFGMPMSRFIPLNIVAGLLWLIPTAMLGFYFGPSIQSALTTAYHEAGTVLLIAGAIVLVYFAVRHIRQIRAVFQRLQWSDFHAVVPSIIGFMAILNIVTAIWPTTEVRLERIQQWLPFEATQESRIVMLFAGIALLHVTRNLALRKQLAWYVAIITLAISVVLHLISREDVEHSVVATSLLVYLVYFRRRFYTRSDPVSLRKALLAMPLLELAVFLYGVTGLYASAERFTWPDGITPEIETLRTGILTLSPDIVPKSQNAARFLSSLQVAGWVARAYILVLLLRPFILRDRQEAPAQDVERIFRLEGDQSLHALAIQPDKHHLLLLRGSALVGYAWKGSYAFSCGDPMAPEDRFRAAVQEYAEHCLKHGWKACIYLASDERLPIYKSLGFDSRQVTEEAIIDLRRYGGPGNDRVSEYEPMQAPDLLIDEQLEEVSEDWLHVHHVGEMGFTIGRFSLESLREGPVFILGDRDRVEAFCEWLPYKRGSAMVLDLIRKRHSAPAGSIEELLAGALAKLRDRGIIEASISTDALERERLDRFHPSWHPRHLVYPEGSNLGRIHQRIAAIQKR